MTYKAIVNKKYKISASSFTQLKRKASRIANQFWNTIDTMIVFVSNDHDSRNNIVFRRFNIKTPASTWKADPKGWH